jgi:hypothetical protein
MPDVPDDYREQVKRHVLEAYGFDDPDSLTPEERAVWDATGRLAELEQAVRAADEARVIGNLKALAPRMPELLREHMGIEVPDGMRFEFR